MKQFINQIKAALYGFYYLVKVIVAVVVILYTITFLVGLCADLNPEQEIKYALGVITIVGFSWLVGHIEGTFNK